MPIPIITNFEVNSASPIDTRLVATNSNALNEIRFPYDGLTVYTKDANLNYTYVAIPQGQAGFPGRWQVSSNGIYGGSGSIIGDTDVNMGSVGSGFGNKSFELILSASSSSDRAQYVTSFIRNQAGSGFEQIEIRNQVRYIDNGISKNGPYISFNPIDLDFTDKRGIIAFGTPDSLFSSTVQRLRIEPNSDNNNGAIVFSPSDNVDATPIYISQNSTYANFIGANWDGVTRPVGGTGSVIISFAGGNLDIFNTDNSGFTPVTQFRIADLNLNTATNVQIRVDEWSTDAGQATTAGRNFVMKSITDVIRTTEHLYTRTQHLGYKKLETFVESGDTKNYADELIPSNAFSRTSDKTLYVSNEGNFFDIELPNVPDESDFNTKITDIRCLRQRYTGLRGSTLVDRNDFPDGTEITIRFTYKTSPIFYIGDNRDATTGGYWSLGIYQERTGFSSSKIKSTYADEPNGTEIKILYSTIKVQLAQNGDVITFRKGGGYWHIMSINRLQTIQQILSSGSALEWDYLNNPSYWETTTLSIIQDQDSTYRNVPLTGSLNLEAPSDPRSPFRFNIDSPDNPNDYNEKLGMPIIAIARDQSGNVFIGGSFQINSVPSTSLNFERTTDTITFPGMGNIILFAKIIDEAYLPNNSSNYSWGYCEVNVTPNTRAGNPFSDNCVTIPGRLVVDITGFVTVEFNMSSWKNVNGAYTYKIDVNVPQFSYQS